MRVLFDCFAVSKRRNEKEIDMQNATPLTVMTVQQASEYLGVAFSSHNVLLQAQNSQISNF